MNAAGCATTGVALAIILAATFAEGAWVTVLLLPLLVALFLGARRHYVEVARETAYDGPANISDPDVPKDREPRLAGIALPDAVLQKIYHDNTQRVLGLVNSAFVE